MCISEGFAIKTKNRIKKKHILLFHSKDPMLKKAKELENSQEKLQNGTCLDNLPETNGSTDESKNMA